MRSSIIALASAAVLLSLAPVRAAESGPFRILSSPTGCVVTFDRAPEQFRVDSLADGGASVELIGVKLDAEESQHTEGCLTGYRILPSYDGRGTTIELRPSGFEFSSVIRSQGSMQIAFDKVTDVAPASGPQDAARYYRIGVGDVLQISVYSHNDLTRDATVGADGKINYSLLGDLVAEGRTVREFQDDITAQLGKSYIVNPQVSVEVKKYASQFAHVTGQVKNPQKVALEGSTTLKDALAQAGGFAAEAGYVITVARKSAGPDGRAREPEVTTFSRKDIELGLANFVLQPDDVVTVSDKAYFYISREVHKPGRYEITPGLTLYQAIAIAEGPTDWADTKKVSLIRTVGDKTRTQVINLKDIERQKIPDIQLVAGDSIVLPRRFL